MRSSDRIALLGERLAQSRFAPNAEHILDVVRGKEALRANLNVEVERSGDKRAPNGEVYHTKIRASTEAIARDQGIIPMGAWQNGGLRNFSQNPIILAYHDHKQPIGRSVHTELTNDSMVQYWEFHGESEVSRLMQKLYERGFMRAASVGFIVQEFSFVDELSDKELEGLVSKYGAAAVRDIYWIATRAELLETSAVPVPSDATALTFDFAATMRSAEAVGIDLSSIRSITNTQDTEMTEAEKKAAEDKVRADAAAAAATANTDLAETVKKGFEAIAASITAIGEAVAGLRTIVEKSKEVVPPAAGAPAGTEGDAGKREDAVGITKLPGETDEVAVARHVAEIVAKQRGAPVPKTK